MNTLPAPAGPRKVLRVNNRSNESYLVWVERFYGPANDIRELRDAALVGEIDFSLLEMSDR